METEAELKDLRGRIRELDSQFARLLVERQNLARRVVEVKARENTPLRNYSVESRVIQRFKSHCREFGLEEQWGVELATLLIRCSVEMQSKMLDSRYSSGRHSILLVGGAGKMGRWFERFCRNQGHQVRIYDPGAEGGVPLADGLEWASLTIVSTPLEATAEVLKTIISHKPKGVVVEISSIKSHIGEILEAGVKKGLKLASLHPLFGPDVTTLHGRNLVICPCGSAEADRAVSELFAETAARLITLSLEEHDRYMSATLAFSHALNLMFGSALRRWGFDYGELQSVASSTFAKQAGTVEDVFRENPQLYFEIQRHADHDQIYALLEQALSSVKAMIENDNREGFVEEVEDVRRYFTS